jgi:membrane protein involved in colicin uptake
MQYDRKADIHAPFGRRKTPEQLEEAARKAEEKAAKKAAKKAEKDARKAARAAEKAEKEAEADAMSAASLGAVDTVIDERPAFADEPAEETYEEGQVFHSSEDESSGLTDEDEDDYSMLEDAETNTRPN